MKNLKITLAIILFGACISLSAQTETLYFDVIHSGESIGTLKAEKTVEGNKTHYKSYTDIEFHMFMTIKIEYTYNVTYIDDNLNHAKVHIMLKGHEKTNVRTEKMPKGYAYFSDEKLDKEFVEEIKHSIEKMFFYEPTDVTKVYAEEHGEFHELKKNGPHTYLKTTPNGHKSTYYYKDGKLQKSDIDAGVIKFSIIRKN
ncbi:MAG: hypothetical protein PSN34_02120 [Urechidicola sp.]|nr:hypothetical protein [Urechidicola sp.]